MRRGNTRRVDGIGRIVVPSEFREELDLSPGDPVEFKVQGKQLVIQKRYEKCVFCGSIRKEGSRVIDDVLVCEECLQKIKKTK